MTLPIFVAAGAWAANQNAISVSLPTGLVLNDILLLCLATANQAIAIANPNGGTWTPVTDSPQGIGTAAAADATRLTVFWSRYNGTQGNISTTDSGDVNAGAILAFRRCVTTGDPYGVTAGGTDATSNTALSIPGGTTTDVDRLIVAIAADSIDSNSPRLSGAANADLVNVTERLDSGTTQASNVGVVAITGEKLAAGTFGATTGTYTLATLKAFLMVSLLPAVAVVPPGGMHQKRFAAVPGNRRAAIGRAVW
jgi:hypothetical protein